MTFALIVTTAFSTRVPALVCGDLTGWMALFQSSCICRGLVYDQLGAMRC